jgi:HlyD family secretion protein
MIRWHRNLWNRRLIAAAGLIAMGLASAWALGAFTQRPHAVTAAGPEERSANEAVRVATIRPKKDPTFSVGIQQLAWVKPYFEASLKTRVSGVVRQVNVNIGDTVKKGDLMAELDVPDLAYEVGQKEATVQQRRQELKVSQAKALAADALVEITRAALDQQKAGVLQAEASRDYRKKRLDRFRELLKRQAINEDLVDEQDKEWRAGEAAWQFAVAGVARAQADLKEKLANVETARSDNELKKSQIDVAQFDLERSKALANYTRITAPFAGVVIRRNVDPGDLVQNATSGNSEPLFSLARIDVVKVISKIPDNAAPFISRGTPVDIQIDQLPGLILKAKVTRSAPAIESADRTLRIEIDLVNSKDVCRDDLSEEALNSCQSNFDGAVQGDRKLLPGMNGYVRVRLDNFGDAYLVPSSALFTRGGKQYAMLAEKGKVRKFVAVVQANDGRTAKIALVRKDAAGLESLVELTGHEDIIANRQSELEEGQEIVGNSKEW